MTVFYILDARTKLFFVILFTFLIFLVDKFYIAVSLLVIIILIRLAARIPFRSITLLKNLTLLAVFIILMQSFFGPGDSYIVNPLFPPFIPFLGGKGYIKLEGFIFGLVIVCRLAALMILLPVFTETTPPHRIAAGLCSLKVNYRIAFIITTAFNLIHFFKNEALIIMDAQKLRGMSKFDRGISGIIAYAGLLFPLMLGAMRKAQISSVVMDCRAFGIYKTRTWTEKPILSILDFWVIIGSFVIFILFLVLNYL
jgi:energy-coupling factor transport system permease protein